MNTQRCSIVVAAETVCTYAPPQRHENSPVRIHPRFVQEALEGWSFAVRDYERKTINEATLTVIVEEPWMKGVVDGATESSELAAYDVVCALTMFGARVRSTLIATKLGWVHRLGPGPQLGGFWHSVDPIPVSNAMVVRAVDIAAGARLTAAQGDRMGRLRQVWNCLKRGFHEFGCGERLIQFVRAIEGCFPQQLFGKQPGTEKWEFRNRHILQELGPSIVSDADVIDLAWEVRSKLVHLEDIRTIPGLDKTAPYEHIARLAILAEFAACHAVARVLETPELFVLQADEGSYRQALRDKDRRRVLWGDPISVEKLYRQREVTKTKDIGDGLTAIR